MDAHYKSFQTPSKSALVKEGIGVLGMKSMGSGDILKSKLVTPIECLHYALSLPTSVVINGIDKMEHLEQAFVATGSFKPMTQPEIDSPARTATAAETGKFERFKTTQHYDSTAQHPDYLS